MSETRRKSNIVTSVIFALAAGYVSITVTVWILKCINYPVYETIILSWCADQPVVYWLALVASWYLTGALQSLIGTLLIHWLIRYNYIYFQFKLSKENMLTLSAVSLVILMPFIGHEIINRVTTP